MPYAGADDGLRRRGCRRRRGAARSCSVGIDQRAVVDRAVLRLDQRVASPGRSWSGSCRPPTAASRTRSAARGSASASASRLPVVLQVAEVHPLAQVEDERVDELVGAARAEHEVGEVVGRRDRRPRRPAG